MLRQRLSSGPALPAVEGQAVGLGGRETGVGVISLALPEIQDVSDYVGEIDLCAASGEDAKEGMLNRQRHWLKSFDTSGFPIYRVGLDFQFSQSNLK